MSDWLRGTDQNNDEPREEEPRFINPIFLEDLGRITSLFLVLLFIKLFFSITGLIYPSWLTDAIGYVNLDNLLVLSCASWIVVSGRLFIGMTIIKTVMIFQLLIIGGFLGQHILAVARALAVDAISFCSGIILALPFRRW